MDPVVHLSVALAQLPRPVDVEAVTAVLVPRWGAIEVARAMERTFGFACGAEMACALDAEVDEARRQEAVDAMVVAGLADLLA